MNSVTRRAFTKATLLGSMGVFIGATSMHTMLAKWQANPAPEKVTGYSLYEYVNGKYRLIKNATGTSVKFQATRGTHYYSLAAFNAQGLGPRTANLRIRV